MSEAKNHGYGMTDSQPEQPSHAEQAKTLVAQHQIGTLSTLSRKISGWPFGSVMPYSLNADGNPIFLLSSMAMHTQNLKQDSRASLLVMEAKAIEDPLANGRVTLMGQVKPVPLDNLAEIRGRYLECHPESTFWVDFKDFSFYQMTIADLYFVGGFGRMDWVTGANYHKVEADPLIDVTADIIQHMNDDHVNAMILIAKHNNHSDETDKITSAKMTAVDRLGFHLQLISKEDLRGIRINFPQPVADANSVRKVLVEMVREARAALTQLAPSVET